MAKYLDQAGLSKLWELALAKFAEVKELDLQGEYGFANIGMNQSKPGSELIDAVFAAHEAGDIVVLRGGDYTWQITNFVKDDVNGFKGIAVATQTIDYSDLNNAKPIEQRCIILYVAADDTTYVRYAENGINEVLALTNAEIEAICN